MSDCVGDLGRKKIRGRLSRIRGLFKRAVPAQTIATIAAHANTWGHLNNGVPASRVEPAPTGSSGSKSAGTGTRIWNSDSPSLARVIVSGQGAFGEEAFCPGAETVNSAPAANAPSSVVSVSTVTARAENAEIAKRTARMADAVLSRPVPGSRNHGAFQGKLLWPRSYRPVDPKVRNHEGADLATLRRD